MNPATRPSAPSALLLLSFSNFVVGIGAFVVIGVLSPIASAFGVDKGAAGGLMTVYAIVYAIASPLLVAVTGGIDRARLLVASMLLFLAGSLLAMLAPSFGWLLAARVPMALGGALLTPVAASVGVALVPPTERGRALATVFGGLTLAQALGVPVGAWLGYAFGWRAAFAVVSAVALAGAAVLAWGLPRGIVVPPASLVSLGQVLRSGRLVLAVSFTAWFIGGLYTLYTYLGPFLEARLGLGRDGVSAMLLVFGCGAVVGNAMGGWLTDRIGPLRTLLALAASQCVLMPVISVLALPLWATGVAIAVWSVFAWSFMVPQQARLATMAPPLVPVLFALNAAAIYVGGSLGSALGGWVLHRVGMSALGQAGAVLMLAGIGSIAIVARLAAALPQPVAPR